LKAVEYFEMSPLSYITGHMIRPDRQSYHPQRSAALIMASAKTLRKPFI